jgi:hypothetical protein
VNHLQVCQQDDLAQSAYAKVNRNKILLEEGFAENPDVCPGTHNPNTPINIFAAHPV